MAPPLQAIEGGTRLAADQQPKRRRRFRIIDGVERWEESAASAWRRAVTLQLRKLGRLLPNLRRPIPPSQDGRHVPMSARWQGLELTDERTGKGYISNFIRSNRYTIWDFVPRQLLFQFSKIANFYFLIIAIMQLIPGLSPVASYTTIAPLAVFVAFSMAKEGFDDYRRYRMDKVENKSDAWILDPNGLAKKRSSSSKIKNSKRKLKTTEVDHEKGRKSTENGHGTKVGVDGVIGTELRSISRSATGGSHVWSRVQWRDLRVGDVVRLKRDQQVPADLVLLSATGPNGIAYIDTMALDGETNLKSKQACPLLAKRCGSASGILGCDATVVSEDPNIDIYSFDGRVTVGDETMPLTTNQVVFRGSTMRNTREAYGMIINSGEECKIRMNANKGARAKSPAMQSIANRVILLVVFILVMLSVGLKFGNDIFEREHNAWYMFGARLTVVEQVFGYIILLNTLIPISLYVSLEIIKIGQFWMLHDVEMYDPETNTPIVANTTTIIENLGQVSYVFSDKTGTLTENVMRFQLMSTGGHVWQHGPGPADSNGQKTGERLSTHALLQHMRRNPGSPLSEKALHFILCMALCNTCLPDKRDDGEIEYQAASPDELALVQAAQELGYVMVDRDSETITLQHRGSSGSAASSSSSSPNLGQHDASSESGTYRLLDLIEFNSDRKRMTVILRTPDNRILVLAKGADSALLPRLRLKQLAERVQQEVSRRAGKRRSKHMDGAKLHEDPESPSTAAHSSSARAGYGAGGSNGDVPMLADADIFEAAFRHIDEFASEGLRTLLFAYRYVDETHYREWKKEYHQAETSLVDRQAQIDTVSDKIERDLELAGITAIEDKLQQGVPDTIDKLRRANIKVWMLTGDKRETAINIGHSAKICKPFSDIFILDSEAPGSIDATMQGVLDDLSYEGGVEHSVVVIDGLTLKVVDENTHSKKLFYDLLTRVDAVICCRASPSQKAAVVKNIRERDPSSMTLAIGDGANDIAMIQASHVGIGISGKEGLQAARISDYSIGQFRFLQRLLLVHGRWNYVRTSRYILGTFWKEMVFFLVLAMYQRCNGYTGTAMYENASLTVFNVLWSSLAVILTGIFEQDLSAETLLAVPELYVYGQRDKGFNFRKYFGWTLMGIAEAAAIWYTIYGVYINHPYYDDDDTTFTIGTVAFTVCVIFINWKMLILEFYHKTWVPIAGFTITIGGWFMWNLVLSAIYAPTIGPMTVRSAFVHTFTRTATFWFAVILALLAAMVIELGVKSIRRVYFPSDTVIMQEIEQQQARERRKEAKARGEKFRFPTFMEFFGFKNLDVGGEKQEEQRPQEHELEQTQYQQEQYAQQHYPQQSYQQQQPYQEPQYQPHPPQSWRQQPEQDQHYQHYQNQQQQQQLHQQPSWPLRS